MANLLDYVLDEYVRPSVAGRAMRGYSDTAFDNGVKVAGFGNLMEMGGKELFELERAMRRLASIHWADRVRAEGKLARARSAQKAIEYQRMMDDATNRHHNAYKTANFVETVGKRNSERNRHYDDEMRQYMKDWDDVDLLYAETQRDRRDAGYDNGWYRTRPPHEYLTPDETAAKLSELDDLRYSLRRLRDDDTPANREKFAEDAKRLWDIQFMLEQDGVDYRLFGGDYYNGVNDYDSYRPIPMKPWPFRLEED